MKSKNKIFLTITSIYLPVFIDPVMKNAKLVQKKATEKIIIVSHALQDTY